MTIKRVHDHAAQAVVSAASPGLSTTASSGGLPGSTLTDIAPLSGGYFLTGTITFLLTDPGSSTVDVETVTVNGNGNYTTPTGFIGTVAGTYSWHVLYSGDGNNNAATANLETVTVTLPGMADLRVSITDGVTGVVPGTSDTYTITVSNNGPDTVGSVTLIDAIPAALSNPAFAPSAGAYDVATGAWSGLSPQVL